MGICSVRARCGQALAVRAPQVKRGGFGFLSCPPLYPSILHPHVMFRPMRIENGLDDSDGGNVTGVKLSPPGAAPWSNSDICPLPAGTFTLNKAPSCRRPPAPFVYQPSPAWASKKGGKTPDFPPRIHPRGVGVSAVRNGGDSGY